MAPRSSETETLELRFSEFGSVDTQSAMLSDSLCYVCHCVMFVKNIKQENKAKIGSSLARARPPSTKQMSANKGTRTSAKTNHLTTFLNEHNAKHGTVKTRF